MIARSWTGAVPTEKADAYAVYLEESGVKELRATPGNRGVYVFRRQASDATEFTVLSLWDSFESIRAFAGDELDRARYFPRDRDFLLTLPATVTHFEARAWMPAPSLNHIDLRVSDPSAARPFFDRLLPALGFGDVSVSEGWVTYGADREGSFVGFTASENGHAVSGRIAFRVPAKGDVDRVGALLVPGGAINVEGPSLCPEYSENYYAVFFEDRDGNRFEVYTA